MKILMGTLRCAIAVSTMVAFVHTYAMQETSNRPPEEDSEDVLVDIPDTALRKAIEEKLGKEMGESITRGEMATLEGVQAVGVEQLVGIEHAVNLDWFQVPLGTVSDLAPLSGLTTLRSLLLRSNNVTDISPLAGLTSLSDLRAGWNSISDLSALSGLTSLATLHLQVNLIADVSPLADLPVLTDLRIYSNPIRDHAPLANESLRYLDVRSTGLADLTPFAGLRLTALYIGGGIADLSPLATLTSLKRFGLDHGGSRFSDLSWLRQYPFFESLTHLDLVANSIVDLSPLAGHDSLVSLQLAQNHITDVSPLAGLTSLTELWLGGNLITDFSALANLTSLEILNLTNNKIVGVQPAASLSGIRYLYIGRNDINDVSPLLENDGLGSGDEVWLEQNPLDGTSVYTHIPRMLERGIDVRIDPPIPADAAVVDIGDPGLLGAVLRALGKGPGRRVGVDEFRALKRLDLHGRGIFDISPLEALSLRILYLGGNNVSDLAPLHGMDQLYMLTLDGNEVHDLSPLPEGLRYLYLTDNAISDVSALADLRYLRELRISGNSITSLAPLSDIGLTYLHVNDNQIADISPLRFWYVRELHMRNNAVRDISPLLNGEELLMVDVRRNPLADEALGVLDTLRERNVTVLAGEAVPYFPAAGDARQGFVRVVNRSGEAGHVFIEAVDDAGVRAGPVRMEVGSGRAVHFNSGDLERGNAGKGLSGGIGAPTAGDWRLSVISALDVEVLSYIRTEDGFVTAMHDVAADAMAPFFNPGDNENQRSILRVVNTEAEPAKWTTGGYDDHGQWHPMAGSLLVRPQRALTLTARALEDDHGLGDGHGKWRLRTRGFPWYAMSLLESPTGHLTNLSTAPDNAVELADGRTLRRLPLFPAAGGSRQGFVRVINRSYSSGEVVIEAVDDASVRSGPVRLTMRPRRVAHFNSMDLETGNADKGLDGGVGVGRGDWRLEVTSELDLMVLSYARTADGFLTSLHDLAPVAEDGGHRVVFFNPGSNQRQVSKLRLINDGERAARVSIAGIDDRGSASGAVSLGVPGGSAFTFTAAELEAGAGDRLGGGLGDGEGKWRLRVRSDEPIAVMSLLETPTGHLTNVSTGTAD